MDYAAVAGSVVLGVPGVRACLVLSQDGLPLAAYPEAEEAAVAALWSRLASVGPVTRGFLTVRSEVWAFVQGERHGAMVVADRAVRPGQMLDVLDGVLAQAAAAEVLAGADRRDAAGVGRGDPRGAARRFSTPLHRDGRAPEQDAEPAPVTADVVVSLEEAPAAPATTTAASPATPAPPVPAASDADAGIPDASGHAAVETPAAVGGPALAGSGDSTPAPVGAPPVMEAPAAEPVAQAVAAPAIAVVQPSVPVAAPVVPAPAAATIPPRVPEFPAPAADTPGAVTDGGVTDGGVTDGADADAAVGAFPVNAPEVEHAEPAQEAAAAESSATAEGRAGGEVDIIALAREFAGLIIERE